MNAIENYLGFVPQGWTTRQIIVDGVKYGDIMMRDHEVHVAVDPEHRRRGWSRRIARAFFAELLDEFKFLITRSTPGDTTEPFIRRLGFVQTNEDSQFRYWWLDHLPFERNRHA